MPASTRLSPRMHPWTPPAIILDHAKRAAARQTTNALEQVLSSDPTLGERSPSLINAIQRSRGLLRSALDWADKLDHDGIQIAFIAPKGAGKSSILNGLLHTWTGTLDRPNLGEGPSEHLQRLSVLPLGAGGTTPCEVRFEYGEAWKVTVRGESGQQFAARVEALAGSALRAAHPNALAQNLSLPIPMLALPEPEPDVRRCLIGVCGLRAGGVSGETTLKELAQAMLAPWKLQFSQQLRTTAAVSALRLIAERFRDQLLARAAYASRQSFVACPHSGAQPIYWLKDLLQGLTWGNWPAQPLPTCIEVEGPTFPRLRGVAQRLRLIDTVGLQAVSPDGDETPLQGRTDLDPVLRSLWTVAVYVAGFTNPPDPVTAVLRAALTGEPQLTPHHRAVVPLVYKGEAILLDPLSSETRQNQRAHEAQNKRSACTDAINALLRHAKMREDWSDTFSPVIDLTESLGEVGAMPGLEAAIEARLQSMGLAWEKVVDKLLREADDLMTRARALDQLAALTLRHFEQHLKPHLDLVFAKLRGLEGNPVRPFADACDSQANGGYLHWKTVESIAYGCGRGSADAFEVTRIFVVSDQMGCVGASLAALRKAIDRARTLLIAQSVDDVVRDVVNFTHRRKLAEPEALEAAIGDAFALAFEAVANRVASGPDSLWGNKKGLIQVINRGKRPLGRAFTATINAWGQRHQAELWAHVVRNLKARGVDLPQP
jgi:hypothetical protein